MAEQRTGQFSKVEVDGHLMIATINRPEVYNACHPMANEELVAAFDEFHANPDLWVAIITGAGDKAFCAGNDLKFHAEYQAKHGQRPPHIATGFGGITDLKIGPDGSLYILSFGLGKIFVVSGQSTRVDFDGDSSTVVGSGMCFGLQTVG